MTYKVQIDNLVRDATPLEAAEIEARNAAAQAEAEAQRQNDTDRAVARQSAIAKLTALGLTAGEAAALFG